MYYACGEHLCRYWFSRWLSLYLKGQTFPFIETQFPLLLSLHFVFPLKCSLSPKRGHFVWLEFLCFKSLFYCTHEKREPSLTASRYFLSNLIYCERSMRTTPLSLEKRPLLNRKSTGKRTNYSLPVLNKPFYERYLLKTTEINAVYRELNH